jgi:hypothetical protein
MNEKDIASTFIDKLIDWKEFELFVADIYKNSDELKVEHDVTLRGKSNAKRQIDVLITQKTKLHTYITLIECKRWKKSVTRQVIDVLFASVEDLNANKGVIFTTKGYEEGAIDYAKSKNIDIFLVRDIRDDEFGSPGKKFSLYLQTFNGKLENFESNQLKFYSPIGLKPQTPLPPFAIHFTKEQKYPDNLQLYNLNNEKGPNFVELLIKVRLALLKRNYQIFKTIFQPENENHEKAYRTKIILDLSSYKFKFLKHDSGFVVIDEMRFDFVQSINQERMDFDRTASVDFALIVENYISNQRNFVSKSKANEDLRLSEPLDNTESKKDDTNVVKDRSLIQISMEHYVNFVLNKETKIEKTEDFTLHIE